MLGIDTNVVIRLIVSDDAEQTRRARELVDQALRHDEPMLVSLIRGRPRPLAWRCDPVVYGSMRWHARRLAPVMRSAKLAGESGRCVASQPSLRPSCFEIDGDSIGNTAEIK